MKNENFFNGNELELENEDMLHELDFEENENLDLKEDEEPSYNDLKEESNNPIATSRQSSVDINESSSVPDDFEIGFSDEMRESLECSGITVADIGVKISKVPIERYKAASVKIDRIAFLTKKTIPIKFHYIDNHGPIVCFGGKCCDKLGTPRIRYLFPIAVYQTDAEGQISGGKVELKILSASEDLYKNICTLNRSAQEANGIDHIDLYVTCTDDKYQKMTLSYAGQALWRKSKAVANFLADRWKQDGDKAYMAVARKVTEEQFMEMMDITEEDDRQEFSTPGVSDKEMSKFFSDMPF